MTFTGLRTGRLFTRQLSILSVSEKRAVIQKKTISVMQAKDLYDAVDKIHKEMSTNNQRSSTKSEQTHTSKTNDIPCNFYVGDHALIHTADVQHRTTNTR